MHIKKKELHSLIRESLLYEQKRNEVLGIAKKLLEAKNPEMSDTQKTKFLGKVVSAVMEFLSNSASDPHTLMTITGRAEVTGEEVPQAKKKASDILSLVSDAFKKNYHEFASME